MGFSFNKPKPYKEYYKDDPNILKETGFKVSGVKNGKFTLYDSDGNVYQKGTYKDGKLHGVVDTFNPMNQIFESFTYKDGIRHGTYREYYFGTDILFELGTCKNGKKVGSYEQYDEYGNVDETGHHKEEGGFETHEYTIYYKDGSIREKGKSQVEGPFTSYYENGQIKEEGHYKSRGLNFSNTYKFQPDEYGEIRPGEKHGEVTIHSEDGEYFTETFYEDGQLHGPFKVFTKNNKLIEEGSYKYDQIHGKHVHYKDGEIFSVEDVESRTDGYLKKFYDDEKTKIMSEGMIKKSQYDGKWIYYNEDGKPIEERWYYNGILGQIGFSEGFPKESK